MRQQSAVGSSEVDDHHIQVLLEVKVKKRCPSSEPAKRQSRPWTLQSAKERGLIECKGAVLLTLLLEKKKKIKRTKNFLFLSSGLQRRSYIRRAFFACTAESQLQCYTGERCDLLYVL